MPRPNRLAILLALAAAPLLAACDKPDNAPGPGGVSMGGARALDRAAEIVEERRVEVPEPQATDEAQTEAEPQDEAPTGPLEVESTAPPIAEQPTD